MTVKRLLIVFVLATIIVGALLWSQAHTGPFFVSGFIESHQIRVGSRVGGRVEQVHVTEGQAVAANDSLLTLEPYDLRARLAEAQAVLQAKEALFQKLVAGPRKEEIEGVRAARDRAQAALDKAVAGPRPLEIHIAADKLARATAELAKAQKDYARIQALFDSGEAAQEERDAVTRSLAVAKASTAQAQNELDLLREGTRSEDIAAARARLAEAQQTLALLEAGTRAEDVAEARATVASAQAAVSVIQRQLAELTVHAPVDSVVEAVDLRPGDLIAPNAPVIALNDPSELWVRAYVPEDRLDLQLGQEVSVRVDSFPGRRFAGHISYISRDAEFTPSNVQTPDERSKQVFRMKVLLDEGLDVLRAGMAADVFLEAMK
jgi:multidrug resistance efflux pump